MFNVARLYSYITCNFLLLFIIYYIYCMYSMQEDRELTNNCSFSVSSFLRSQASRLVRSVYSISPPAIFHPGAQSPSFVAFSPIIIPVRVFSVRVQVTCSNESDRQREKIWGPFFAGHFHGPLNKWENEKTQRGQKCRLFFDEWVRETSRGIASLSVSSHGCALRWTCVMHHARPPPRGKCRKFCA